MFLQASFCQVGVIHCKWIKDADMVVIEIWVNCFVCDLLNQSRLSMVHQRWEAPFVTTFQNKDNLLIYTKTICKSSNNMQKNIISFFCTVCFLSNSQKFTCNAAFLFIHLFICVAVNLAKSCIQCVQKKKSSFFLPFLSLSFFFQSLKKKNANLFIYFELRVSQVFSFWKKTTR